MKKEITLFERKNRSLSILIYLDSVCKENGITYSLGYGSLLGAIRHGGFIPWDDDIDIICPVADYIKLIKILETNSLYDLKSHKKKDWIFPFSKLSEKNSYVYNKEYSRYGVDETNGWGISIDIFPVFPCKNGNSNEFFYRKLKFLRYCILKSRDNMHVDTMKSKIFSVFCKIIGTHNFQLMLFSSYKHISHKNRKYMGCPISPYGDNDIYESNIFDRICLVSFENYSLPVVSRYDEVLGKLYGKYMILPDEDKRNSGHFVYIYDK